MDKKPEKPIYIDYAQALLNQLTVTDLVKLSNILLNKLTLREFAEVFADLGYRPEMSFQQKETE